MRTIQPPTTTDAALAEWVKAAIERVHDRIMPGEDEIARMSPPEIDRLLCQLVTPPRIRVVTRIPIRR